MDFGIHLETQQKESVTFKGMNIPREILGNIRYPIATPIQRKVIPKLLTGEDLIAVSRTGSGKTYAYVIPILMRLLAEREAKSIYTKAKAIIIVPTYELATQVFSVFQELSKNGVHPGLFTGIGSLAHSFNYLVVGQFEVAICTPGRLEHLLNEVSQAERNKPIFLKIDDKGAKREVSITDQQLLDKISRPDIVVIDEMDRIFEDKSLSLSLERILEYLKDSPQFALFSATHHKGNTQIQTILGRPNMELIEILGGVSDHLEQGRLTINNFLVQEDLKFSLLLSLLKKLDGQKILVFVSTCKRATIISEALKSTGIAQGTLSSLEAEESRDQVMTAFKDNQISVLISTDVGCRGLDIKGIGAIIEYDYAPNRSTAVHRVGRMNRGKAEQGTLFSFIRKADIATYLAFLNHIYSEKPRDPSRLSRLCFASTSCIHNSQHTTCSYLGMGTVPPSVYSASQALAQALLAKDPSFATSYQKFTKTNPPAPIDPQWVVSVINASTLPIHPYFGTHSTDAMAAAVHTYKPRASLATHTPGPNRRTIRLQARPNPVKPKVVPRAAQSTSADKFKDPSFIPYENIKSSTFITTEDKPDRTTQHQDRARQLSKPPGQLFTEWKKDNRDRLCKGFLLKRPSAEEEPTPTPGPKPRRSDGETHSVRKVQELREAREKAHQERRLKVQKKRKTR
ncbi:ATP-dependent RNA helicase DDX54/DBP10 [Nematocida homosporus]|uniref:ATP-dependent RNA helicase DDX54/DBP10 n=1 Tax=Nematocida homosporus TaxID=1912981 RepID=UPI002220802A|nr:ATP-dependent RNA helicase DDX54/DBP10 [Nematocida homosporus]KAI5186146.1 ATP-dependent RNA helicase DDX54/DBP10 [Nematocida homosporus]